MIMEFFLFHQEESEAFYAVEEATCLLKFLISFMRMRSNALSTMQVCNRENTMYFSEEKEKGEKLDISLFSFLTGPS